MIEDTLNAAIELAYALLLYSVVQSVASTNNGFPI